jgi:beta-N-acetylhexosaminidase
MSDSDARLMLAFSGHHLPDDTRARLAVRRPAGVTLFRFLNVADAHQLRALTDEVQALAPPGRPFVIAIDHEGGQLIGLGADATPFAGNMALGAAGDAGLARRVAAAIGRELRAVGVNVDYAPVCDLATNPRNPALGIRCFGDDPGAAATLVAATVRGLHDAGVASGLKHFPGGGEASADPHLGLPLIERDRAGFMARELEPFRAGIAAGADLVMTGHPAVPGLNGDASLPGTLSRAVVHDLLRDELQFSGVTISDALDMGAVAGHEGVNGGRALAAGQDLLLLPADATVRDTIAASVAGRHASDAADARIDGLRAGLHGAEGDPSIVGCAAHRELAEELARRSVTLLRDRDGLLPVRLPPTATLGVVMPRPVDRTPADTSSSVAPGLATAVRRHHGRVMERIVDPAPGDEEIAAVAAWAESCDLLLIGTIDASFEPAQAALVSALLATRRPAITLALRTPWDLSAYPEAGTHACTYSILPPSLEAVAGALWGTGVFPGRLPVGAAVPA